MAVAVRLPGGQTHVFLSGHASLSPDRPVTRQTVFAVASVSKTFVAALILQLAEEDRLSLDDVIGRYVPGAPKARSATIRQLLSHRSGIYDYFESPRYAREVFADPDRRWTYEDIMGLVKSGYCPAGQCYHYSNTNYVILGRIAEVVTGRPLHELLRERFFDPLGLDDTVLQPFEPTPRDAAHGHWTSAFGVTDHTRDSEVIPHMAAASVANAAGAIASTARDLVRWTAALYGGDVLSRRSRKLMAHVQPPDAYGLGTRRAWFAGRPALGHRGGIRGFESSIWYFPRDDLSIAITSNRGLWTPDVVVVPRVLKILSGPG
jgi:D-alanyl-D-alanine carboxypeptidase